MPPVDKKTPLQVLIENTGPKTPVKDQVRDVYRACNSLPKTAQHFTEQTGAVVHQSTIWLWMTERWGWRIENTLVIPEEQESE